jgi:CAAX amino terminal protease family.
MHKGPSRAPETDFPSNWRSVAIFTAVLVLIAIAASSATQGNNPNRLRIYLSAIATEWGAILYIWHVARSRGSSLGVLIGGSWSPASVARDILTAAVFWVIVRVVLLATRALLDDRTANAGDRLIPHTMLELIVWVAVAVTAGICEEVMFRGFLQRQLLTLTRSAAIAIVVQAVIFGASHAYQGWKPVVIIMVYGLLAGVLAHWRRTLRPGIVAHAWQDLAAGLLQLKWL